MKNLPRSVDDMYKVLWGSSQDIKMKYFQNLQEATVFFTKTMKHIEKNNLNWTVAMWQGRWLLRSYHAPDWE